MCRNQVIILLYLLTGSQVKIGTSSSLLVRVPSHCETPQSMTRVQQQQNPECATTGMADNMKDARGLSKKKETTHSSAASAAAVIINRNAANDFIIPCRVSQSRRRRYTYALRWLRGLLLLGSNVTDWVREKLSRNGGVQIYYICEIRHSQWMWRMSRYYISNMRAQKQTQQFHGPSSRHNQYIYSPNSRPGTVSINLPNDMRLKYSNLQLHIDNIIKRSIAADE